MEILWYSMLSFRVCLAFYVSLDKARHSVEICGAWFAAIEIYENLGAAKRGACLNCCTWSRGGGGLEDLN
jgi:hypothetical protein